MAGDTRREILDAALDLFAQKGYFGTSVRQIATAVGVRESALYHHFESKQAVLETLMDELGPGKAERLAGLDVRAIAEEVGARELLRQIAHTMLEEWATPREQKFARLMMAEGPRLGVSGVIHPLTIIARAQEHLARLFSSLSHAGHLKPIAPEVLAVEFIGPMLAMRMMHLVLSGQPPDMKRLRAQVDSHLKFFWDAARA